jgi:lysophospholipase L1-like esterase
MMARWRYRLYVVFINCVLILMGIIAFEASFGHWFSGDPWLKTERFNVVRGQTFHYNGSDFFHDDTGDIVYTRDQYGLRGDCSPKDVDILTIGGSTTEQRLVTDKLTWQAVLQTMLRKNGAKPNLCVSNAGVHGHTTFGHLASFKEWFPLIPHLKPRYVLLYIGINDAEFRTGESIGYDTRRTDKSPAYMQLLQERSALYRLLWNLKTRLFPIEPTYAGYKYLPPYERRYVVKNETPNVGELVSANSAKFQTRLEELLAQVEQMGAKPICVSQPARLYKQVQGQWRGIRHVFFYGGRSYNGLDYRRSLLALNAVMQQVCVTRGGYYIDLEDKYFDEDDFHDYVHLRPAGAAKVAEYLFEEMQKQGITQTLSGQ